MKFLHLSDLHLGKRVYEASMLEDQKYILEQILSVAEEEKPDGVLIAGDIYDKAVPSAEAVRLCDGFLTRLADLEVPVFVISGNHDSAERLAFGARLMSGRGVYISPPYDGDVEPVVLRDEWGEVAIWLLPFLRPSTVRHALEKEAQKENGEAAEPDAVGNAGEAAERDAGGNTGEAAEPDAVENAGKAVKPDAAEDAEGPSENAERSADTAEPLPEAAKQSPQAAESLLGSPEQPLETGSYQAALQAAVSRLHVDRSRRNVLVAHQFVAGASRCESEDFSVGGLDNVDASVFDAFDYVALGHIHSPQHVGRQTVRYCGTPLKYSFSECGQEKSVTVVELGKKGDVTVRKRVLVPLRDMRRVRGTYLEVTARSFYENTNTRDYMQVTLTDEEDVPDGMQKLRVIYPNLLRLEYDNRRTRENRSVESAEAEEEKSGQALFAAFYELQNNRSMSEAQTDLIGRLFEELKGGEPR